MERWKKHKVTSYKSCLCFSREGLALIMELQQSDTSRVFLRKKQPNVHVLWKFKANSSASGSGFEVAKRTEENERYHAFRDCFWLVLYCFLLFVLCFRGRITCFMLYGFVLFYARVPRTLRGVLPASSCHSARGVADVPGGASKRSDVTKDVQRKGLKEGCLKYPSKWKELESQIWLWVKDTGHPNNPGLVKGKCSRKLRSLGLYFLSQTHISSISLPEKGLVLQVKSTPSSA